MNRSSGTVFLGVGVAIAGLAAYFIPRDSLNQVPDTNTINPPTQDKPEDSATEESVFRDLALPRVAVPPIEAAAAAEDSGLSLEERVLQIQNLLNRQDLAGLSAAFTELRAARFELGDLDQGYMDLMASVADQLLDVSSALASNFGARGDFATAGSIVSDLCALAVSDSVDADLHAQADITKFSLEVLLRAGMSVDSQLLKSLTRSAEFSASAKRVVGQDFDTVFVQADKLERFAEQSIFDGRQFQALLDSEQGGEAAVYLGNALQYYSAQASQHPASAFAGLSAVLASAAALNTAEQNTAMAGETLLRVAGQMLSEESHSRASQVFASAENMLETLENFGVQDSQITSRIALLARERLKGIAATDPALQSKWEAILSRFGISGEQFRF